MERKINTLEEVTIDQILTVFNEAFSDYFIPFKLTKEQLSTKLLVDKTDLSLSVGVFENEKLIAFILHGIDKIDNQRVAYNGGTGVIPEKRGAGLTKEMYRFILPLLAEKGISRLLLEVISKNIQAIKSYEKSGFQTVRQLLCYKGEVMTSNINKHVIVKRIAHYNWELMTSFWEIHPTWQNAKSVINQLKSTNISLGAYIKNQLVGYLIFNPSNKRIQQIAVSKEIRRKGIASKLISTLIEAEGKTLSIINVDKRSSPIHAFLTQIGFEVTLEQLEMGLQFDNQ
ncbi:MAG: GNAT family N-acetyltransferase [Bacteroidota bacterium]